MNSGKLQEFYRKYVLINEKLLRDVHKISRKYLRDTEGAVHMFKNVCGVK
jgi:hypothetical protein